MAVAYQSKSQVIGTGTSGVGTEPTGTVQNDVLLASYIVPKTAAAIVAPSGWTQLFAGQSTTAAGNGFRYWVGYILRGSSAPALTWTHGGASTYRELHIFRANGEDTTTQISGSAGTSAGTGTNPDPPSATPADANCLSFAWGVNWIGSGGSGWGAPTGYTMRSDNTAGNDTCVATKLLTGGPTAENPAAFSGGGGSGDQIAFTVLIKPAASVTNLTVTPGAASTTWAGTTPSRKSDITRTPTAPSTAWSGTTPALKLDRVKTPGAPNIAWAGSTPGVIVDVTLTPGAANVEWEGSAPDLIFEGAVTLSPNGAEVTWSGSTPTVSVVPDEVPPEETGIEDVGGRLLADFSTEEPRRDLTLRPRAASMFWNATEPMVRIVEPRRPTAPAPRVARPPAIEQPPEPEPEVDLYLRPSPATCRWSGARPEVVRFVRAEALEAAEAKIRELEAEHEEEIALLVALSAE